MTKARYCIAPAVLLGLLGGWVQPALGQSAAKVFQTAYERFQAATEGIQSYTVVQETMGMETTTTYERKMVDGQSVFVPEGQEKGASGWARVPAAYEQMGQRARLDGEETVDGNACWVAVVDDFEGLDLGGSVSPEESGDFTPKKGTFYIDKDDYLLRKMVMEGEMHGDQGTSPVTMGATMSDYRTVEGWNYPFRVDMSIQGVPTGMSPEEAAENRKKMKELQDQLESMPESQRSMVERMIKPQIDRIQKMLESGTLEATIITKKLTVSR